MISIFSLMICVIVAYPINFNPFKQHFFDLVFNKKEISNLENIVSGIIFVSVTCIVSILFPNIAQVLSILGGLLASTMCYLIPMIIQVKLSKKPWTSPSNLSAILFFSTLVLIGYTSVVITIYEIVKGI